MELIEVKAKTVELAKQAALEELGIEDHKRVEWEVLQEPARGFLGVGRQDAIVRAKRKPPKRRRSRGGRSGKARPTRGATGTPKKKKKPRPAQEKGSGRQKKIADRPKEPKGKPRSSIPEQMEVANDFLEGLLEAIAVKGEVKTRHENDLIVSEIEGEETETLVGQRGSGIEALHTIAKSVIKRKTSGGARLRLDVAGYGSRRREALAIYADGLVEQVSAEGGELMLEPMNAADRKVIHDSVSKHENVRSFSEGEAPQRYVVIAYTDS
jgi:spoIIIJ-associated protein